jgi:hypothetical protein
VPGLGKIVGKADNLAFGGLCNGVVGALANGIVRRKLQIFDVGADHDWALVGGDIPVGQTKAVDVQIALAEILVFLIVEGFECGGLVGLESRDGVCFKTPLPSAMSSNNCLLACAGDVRGTARAGQLRTKGPLP